MRRLFGPRIVVEAAFLVAVPVLAHRLSLTTQAWADGTRASDIVTRIVADVAGPPAVGTRTVASAS